MLIYSIIQTVAANHVGSWKPGQSEAAHYDKRETAERICETFNAHACATVRYHVVEVDEESPDRIPSERMLKDAERAAGNLFAGVGATAVVYCDKSRERDGDYLKVARLFYRELKLEVLEAGHELLPIIQRDAAAIIARRGEQFPIDACGHTVRLGG